MVYDKAPFPTDAVQFVTPGRRVRRAAHYMAAMGLWRPTSGPVFPGPIPVSSCNSCMACDFSPAYGVQLHDPRLLEYVGAPESARLLSRSPEYWLHHLGHEKTLGAALQLQHDAGLILSNVQVLQQLVTSFNRTSSEVMRVTFGRAPFPADAMQQVVPSYWVRSAAHYMAAMGLWRPPSSPGVRGPLPSATCNACMWCSDCFPDFP